MNDALPTSCESSKAHCAARPNADSPAGADSAGSPSAHQGQGQSPQASESQQWGSPWGGGYEAAFSGSLMRKRDDFPGATGVEAAGLHWLAQPMADGAAPVVPVRCGAGWLEEPRMSSSSVDAQAAEAFGRALARSHAAGAPCFGAAPPLWDGGSQMGRSNIRLRPAQGPDGRSWGEFYADDRIAPYIRPGRDSGALSTGGAALIERLCERLRAGEFDAPQPRLVVDAATSPVPVARTHGDLWCGNVLWVPRREVETWYPGDLAALGCSQTVGVLIDPMAHGGHAETDLAALGVFGQRYLERIVCAYDEVSPLADGWRERIGLHQLHMLMIHVYLFGVAYGPEAVSLAKRYA